jgi:hypothetical protein
MEFFSEIWVWIVSTIGGLSLSAIVSAVIYGCLKGAFNKTISKINVESIADKATEKGIERVKKVSFTHNIQPLVESGLEKVNEKAAETFKEELVKLDNKYNNIINILEKQAAYFDNSIGVSEEKKAELKQAIVEAQNKPVVAESVVIDEIVIPNTKQAVEPKTERKSTTKVER